MNRSITLALGTLLALSPALTAGCPVVGPCFVPRTPQGIYALVNVNDFVKQMPETSPTNAQIDTYLNTMVYPGLLSNPDVSGITLYVNWSLLNPNQTGVNEYNWNPISDLLNQAAAAKKTVQLVVTPGVYSPTWLLGTPNMNDGILKSCNYLFNPSDPAPPAGTECGKVTFTNFLEGGRPNKDLDVPMPWNSTYKTAWQNFLTSLATQFEFNPSLVSIAIAGPTASSEEISLPTTRNTLGATQVGTPGLTPEQMWITLLAHHYTSAYKDYTKYLNTDVAFIDEWEHAIDMFGKTFSGITLTLSTSDGLPNLGTAPAILTSPVDFAMDCPGASVDCAAETTILAYFMQSSVGGANAKAYQVDGLNGTGSFGNLNVRAVKQISLATDMYTSPSQRILGGAQFVTPAATANAANGIKDEGVTAIGACPSACSVEQAEYNVLVSFFDETSQGPNFPLGTATFVQTSSSAPLNYLQIWAKDITYATADVFGKQPVIGSPYPMSAQDLLHKASLSLALIAEH